MRCPLQIKGLLEVANTTAARHLYNPLEDHIEEQRRGVPLPYIGDQQIPQRKNGGSSAPTVNQNSFRVGRGRLVGE